MNAHRINYTPAPVQSSRIGRRALALLLVSWAIGALILDLLAGVQ